MIDIPPFGARTVLWVAAQLHVFFGAFILGALIFIVISEYLGYRRGDERYERLGREMMKTVAIAYSFTAVFGVLFAFILMGPYQASTSFLMQRFFPVFGSYGLLILVETVLMYSYWYSWSEMDTPRKKGWHIALGVLVNIVGTGLMFLMNAVASYMLTPPEAVKTASLWQLINNPSWNALNLHRFIGNLTFGGFVVALFAAFMFLTARSRQDRAFYDWMGYTGNFIGTGMMLIIPIAGYIYARELFHYDATISTLLMADKLSWFFEIQGVLVGLLFLGANYYMWLSIQRIEGGERFGTYMKIAFAVMIFSLAIWITPQAFLPDLTTSPSGDLGITELAIPANLAFLGLMMAKALAVTAIVILTFVTYLIYRRAQRTGRIIWGEIDVRAQYTLIFLPAVAVYTMGLMGAIRELARGGDFVFRVVADPSPYWY
ncbi:MAG: cytochrome ubiquinol oxidase subunit I, partial [Anaerolineales bacterium]